MTAVPPRILSGPDIDKLANGLVARRTAELQAKVDALTEELNGYRGGSKSVIKQNKELTKKLKSAENREKNLQDGLAAGKEARTQLIRENAAMRTILSNLGLNRQQVNERIQKMTRPKQAGSAEDWGHAALIMETGIRPPAQCRVCGGPHFSAYCEDAS
jgi:uncharacterized phage infection (PIP) family protein YhgE